MAMFWGRGSHVRGKRFPKQDFTFACESRASTCQCSRKQKSCCSTAVLLDGVIQWWAMPPICKPHSPLPYDTIWLATCKMNEALRRSFIMIKPPNRTFQMYMCRVRTVSGCYAKCYGIKPHELPWLCGSKGSLWNTYGVLAGYCRWCGWDTASVCT